jgi:VCBS repeat-containing protein
MLGRQVGLGSKISFRLVSVLVAGLLIQLSIPISSVYAANATVGGGANVAYTENDPATLIGTGLTVDGGPFDGKYIEFGIGTQAASDILSLQKVSTADTTEGVVSVVGDLIFIGENGQAALIGSIDEIRNGLNGQPLRINFASNFSNAGFENATTGTIGVTSTGLIPSESTALDGWTIYGIGDREHYINLGTTILAGSTSLDDLTTYPANNLSKNPPRYDDLKPAAANFVASITTAEKSEGSKSLRLAASGVVTNGSQCEVVHGPAAVSAPFTANTGDVIYFDWKAAGGQDDYDVFGYLLKSDGSTIKVIDDTGKTTTSGVGDPGNGWITKTTSITSSGEYRFVFVSGTHDATCGTIADAVLYIDNIKVFGNKATATNVQAIARLLTYESTSDNPAATRTVTFTAVPDTGTSASATFDINITAVNDGPSASSSSITLYDTAAVDTFVNQTGNITPTDPDDTTFTFAITGGTSADGVTTIAGTYGTFSIDQATGAYTYDPDDTAINSITESRTDVFTITVTDPGGLSNTHTFTVNIAYEAALVTAPSSFSVNTNTTDAPLTGISVSGLQQNVDYSVSISLINAAVGTTAKIATLGTAELAFGFAAGAQNSFTDLTIIGTAAEINAALATLKITTGATVNPIEMRVSATKFESGVASFRGNYYIARTGGAYDQITWADANTAAKASTYLGLTGYLVTITSQAEQDFVFSKIENAANVWIGASDAATEGRWEWDPTGGSPEAGKQFWEGVDNGSRVTTEGLDYANWCNGEPNNANNEDYAVTNWNLVQGATSSCWNDLSGTNTTSVQGYVIEYGTGSASANPVRSDVKSITISVPGAPSNVSSAATSITGIGAVLNSSVTANGEDSTNRFCISTSNTLSNCATSDNVEVTTITPSSNATTSGYLATSVSATVTGLAYSTTYYYQSYSTNSLGGPIYGTVRSFTTSAPDVPGAPVASAGNTQATVTVTPANTGTPTSYLVTSNPGGFTCTVTGASGSCTVTGLSNGVSYTFTSIAIYNGVNSSSSAASNAVTPRAPAPPRPIQTDVVRPPSTPANPFAPTNVVQGNFTRPISSVSLNGQPLSPTNWTQSPTAFELETRSLRPGRYEVVINNGSATPLTFTFEKPAPIEVTSVIPSAGLPQTATPVVLEGDKPVAVTVEPKQDSTGFTIKGDKWQLELSAKSTQAGGQAQAPVVRDNLLTLSRNLQIVSNGNGFMPYSIAKIYIFSEPTLIGEVEVKPDGTFETQSNLPEGIELGQHTLQIVGVSPANTLRSSSLKVLFTESPSSLTIGFSIRQRIVATSYLEAIRSIFDQPVKKIVIDAHAKPSTPKVDRKGAAARAVATVNAIKTVNTSVELKVRNKRGKLNLLCAEFKNRCVVVTVRR